MGKRLFGKVLICVLSIALCFGFVGVKEVHAATNKVINEKTGVSYTTLSAAITALGSGSAGESVTLTVDGAINETAKDITIDYAGELSIVGINSAVIYSNQPYASIIVAKNTKIKSFKNIKMRDNNSGGSPHIVRIYGEVEEMIGVSIARTANSDEPAQDDPNYDTTGFSDRFSYSGLVTGTGFLYAQVVIYSGGKVGTYVQDQAGDVWIKEGAVVGTISLNTVSTGYGGRDIFVSGNVGEINSPNEILEALYVSKSGQIGIIKNTEIYSCFVYGTVDVFDGSCVSYIYDIEYDSDMYGYCGYTCGGLCIGGTGRINEIKGGSKFYGYRVCDSRYAEPVDIESCLINRSQFPIYLEPDLNGTDLSEGYGCYETGINDISGSIVYPVSASGYYYKMSDAPLADGFYHLVVGDVRAPGTEKKVPISKPLVQNGTAAIPDMTFNFNFEQQSEWEGISYVSKDTNPTPIGEKSITITESDVFTGTDPYVGDLTGKKLYYGTYENVLSDFDPQVAGTYLYLVKEKVPDPKIPNVTYTGSEYVLKIVVDANKEIVDIPTITLYRDGAGKTKADYTNPPRIFDEKQELIFYNTYGTGGGTTPTGIVTNILPFIIIGGAGVGGLVLYVMFNVKRKRKEIS